jgi:hypothetical protein
MCKYNETNVTNPSSKGMIKKESIDFGLNKPIPKEKRISKCFIKTKNGVEYSVVETNITNPCNKKNSKYTATSESLNSGKKLTNPNYYAMPKGYHPPSPDCLPPPPSSWLPEIELSNTESCEISNGFEPTTIPTTSSSLLLQPSFFTRSVTISEEWQSQSNSKNGSEEENAL